MAKGAGRDFVFKIDDTAVAGCTTLSMTVNGEAIDVSDKDSNGRIQYLNNVLTGRQIVFQVEGIEDGTVLRDIALGAQNLAFITNATVDFADGGEIAADMVMSGYTRDGAHEGAENFSCTFSTDGAWTYTAPA